MGEFDLEAIKARLAQLTIHPCQQRQDIGALVAEVEQLRSTLDSIIRELQSVLRPGFRGDNPVWACGKLRDDYQDLQAQVHSQAAEIDRLRSELAAQQPAPDAEWVDG